jgi:hypothetical protein
VRGRPVTNDAVPEEWRERPVDPASNQDLGYHIDDWERIRARDVDAEKFLYLPGDEEMLRREAFIVVHPDDVCDLDNHR